MTRPRTLLSSCTCSSHESTCAYLFCNNRYSLIERASGRSMAAKTASSTMTLFFSVTFSNLTPRPIRRFAICWREPTLKVSTLSLSCLPVFSDTLLWTIGGNVSPKYASMSFILSLKVAHSSRALS